MRGIEVISPLVLFLEFEVFKTLYFGTEGAHTRYILAGNQKVVGLEKIEL
jgi:hypothetical protein